MGGSQGKMRLGQQPATVEQSVMKLKLKRIFKVANDIQQEPCSPLRAPETPCEKRRKRRDRKMCFWRRRRESEYASPSVSSTMAITATPSDREFGTPSISQSRRRTRSLKKVLEHFDPRVLAKYDIKAMIGKGSFSRVVRVEHLATKEQYAVKLVPARTGTGPFENEISILSRVQSNPFVIKLQEVFRTTNRVYMVMELATGGELYDRIVAKGTFTECETITTIRMLLSGLQYLHRLGITHRDLKPENLLFIRKEPDSRLVITDFGLAHQRLSSEDEMMSETCGTPEYIAPEVLMRFPYNNKVDLWAVGVVCYILLSGIMPFDDRSRTYLYRQIINGRYYFYPEFWSQISHEAKGFVSALLDTDPSDRLCADSAIRHPWIVSGGQIRAINTRQPMIMHNSFDDSSLNGSTSSPYALPPPKSDIAVRSEIGRTRSNRSIRSVARSDHGHRVNSKELEKLSRDPEIVRILNDRYSRHRHKSGANSDYGTMESSKDYGIV